MSICPGPAGSPIRRVRRCRSLLWYRPVCVVQTIRMGRGVCAVRRWCNNAPRGSSAWILTPQKYKKKASARPRVRLFLHFLSRLAEGAFLACLWCIRRERFIFCLQEGQCFFFVAILCFVMVISSGCRFGRGTRGGCPRGLRYR